MDNKFTLINSIGLLYREAEYSSPSIDSTDFIKSIVDKLKIADNGLDVTTSRDCEVALKKTVYALIDEGRSKPFNRTSLLQRIRIDVADEEYLYQTVEEITKPLENMDDVLSEVQRIDQLLRQNQFKDKIKETISLAYRTSHFDQEQGINWQQFTNGLSDELAALAMRIGTAHVMDEVVESVSLSDPASIASSLAKARSINTEAGIMRLGWQGFNRMLGEVGGLRRGDEVVIGALQHNFKSGMLLHLPRQIAMYNTPYMLNKEKKPLILHASLENAVSDNIMQMYKWFKENETGELFSIRDSNLDVDEAASYIKEKLEVNGYHFEFVRVDPSTFTYNKLCSMLLTYEKQGYEVHLLSLDYLNMMSKDGCVGGNTAAEIRDLFRRLRNFCSPRGITLLTAHQLSPDAKLLQRQGVDNFVKEVANKGYYADCKGIDQEVDLEITINLERPGDGSTFLTAHRGKHRMPFITPEKDLYTVYKFQDIGAIPDDVLTEDMSLKKVGVSGLSTDGGDWMV